MAKNRIVNTRFWIDEYICKLDPIEKLLFLYFLTNPMTEICGIYEIPIKTIAVDTGIEQDMVHRIIRRFSRDKKVFYKKGWIIVVNFIRYQIMNPKVEMGIKNCLEKVPLEIITFLDKLSIDYQYSTDSLLHIIKYKLNINKDIAKENLSQTFSFTSYLEEMMKDKQRIIQIIGYFFKFKGLKFENLQEIQAAIKRHLRAAKELQGFDALKVHKAMEECKRKYSDISWTLETVLKELTK